MKNSLFVSILFGFFATICLILCATGVVPKPQALDVLKVSLLSGTTGLVSAQIWSLHREIARLRAQQEDLLRLSKTNK